MSRERNILLYYFNVNLNSIQGRITFGFVITLFMAISLLFLNNLLWQQMDNKKDVIMTQMKPIQSECIKLINLTRETQTNMIRFIYLKNQRYEEENKKYWLVDISAQKDTLLHYIKLYNNPEVKNLYTELNKYLGELKQQQRFLERSLNTGQDPFTTRQQVENDLIYAQTELEKITQKLINRVNQNEKKLLRDLAQDKRRANAILVISAILGFIVAYGLGIFLFGRIFGWIREVSERLKKLDEGNFPEDAPIRKNELKNIARHTNQLKTKLLELQQYAETIAEGNLQTAHTLFEHQGKLGETLYAMQQALHTVNQEERRRIWTTQGLTSFSEILREHNSQIEVLCRKIISKLVTHMDATQGAIFLINKEGEVFDLVAAYALGREKFIQRKIALNEGLVGRVYQEKDKVYLEELPEDYTQISSGLGSTIPRTLILLPLSDEQQTVRGVIELAALRKFENYEIEFLERLCTNIASTLWIMQSNLSNKELLEEFQKNTLSLKRKDKESQKITETLQQTRQEVEDKLHEVHRENEKLNAVLGNIMEAIVIANAKGTIEVFNRASEHLFGWKAHEVIGKNIKVLMPVLYSKMHDQYMESYLKTQEKKIIGRGRLVEGKRKEGDIFPVYLSVTEVKIENEVLFTAIFRRINVEEDRVSFEI